MNKVIMMGRMVADPELKTTPQGITVCSFRIAVDRNIQKKGEDKKADFFNVVAWRSTGEFVSKYFKKGKPVLVDGEMTTRQYTDKNGNPATWYEIVANNVYFVTGDKPSSEGGGGYYGDYYGAGNYSGSSNSGFSGGGYGGGYGGGNPTASADNSGSQNSSSEQSSSNTPDFSSADDDGYPF